MKKGILKKAIIITVIINVIIFLAVGAKITFEKSKEAIVKQIGQNFQIPKFPGAGGGFGIYNERKPTCADSSDYHGQLIYARPADSADRFLEVSPKLKKWLSEANGILNTEAERFKVTADLKMVCLGGEVKAENVVLPKARNFYDLSADTNQAVITDLMKLGYSDKKTKYIVWFDGDGNPSGCGGSVCISQASKKGPDDKLSEDNIFNIGPDFALLFKIEDSKVSQFGTNADMLIPIAMLHEYAHTMGALQQSAPHSTKKEKPGVHCTDTQPIGQGGTDIMCKSDAKGEVFGNECPGMYPFRFDCNNDDYFNPKPQPGSYLATHWNLGSSLNRFIQFSE